ncbi:hypothetical protein DJ79_16875 [Halorubrum ezzemoulense]|jgi:predicted AlkP superfamily phosphohydrolase/phosphomutase|uniref:DUF3006 domain-containing protein n=1 Tax=Halorubrum ezzemoulense TaxID=337243 RepID=A0A256J830_HALEZ|nr:MULTISPECIES: DUF3006 family protein [Halorubrum]MDB2243117.1 DUF3006 family protein [Halorubrum ezzemoulense]MDB2283623.1 DUF3006 family protein [Halorubrum ezzemoulense]OYR64979.1 hypothetical protein DJ79_16875 [Halorubrum ezzemoulense]TKX37507.1 DUF3006 family protein [Halorubrum sp. CGM4_25_10-8A]TKX62438.1 DUF3006 family protein [Halorubrum sp. GN12_10-3_MGM]
MTTIDLPNGEYTAVVDSIEDGLATVFFEQDGEEVGNAVVEPDELPSDGQHADAILEVEIRDGAVYSSQYQSGETERRSNASQGRFDRLSKRPPSDRDP